MGTGKMHNGAREHVGLSLLEDVINSLEWNPCSAAGLSAGERAWH